MLGASAVVEGCEYMLDIKINYPLLAYFIVNFTMCLSGQGLNDNNIIIRSPYSEYSVIILS